MSSHIPPRYRPLAWSLLPVLLADLICYLWIDRQVASWFKFHLGPGGIFLFDRITELGQAQYSLIPAAILWLGCRWPKPAGSEAESTRRLGDGAAYIFLSVAASGLFVDVVKMIIGRYRPGELFDHGLYGFAPFHVGWSVASFPSGHTQTAFAMMVPLMRLLPEQRRWWLAIALLIMASRIVLSVHYLGDTLMGAWVGTAGAILVGDALEKRRERATLVQPT